MSLSRPVSPPGRGKRQTFQLNSTKQKAFLAKKRYIWSILGQNQVHIKTKYKTHARSPAVRQPHIVPAFGLKWARYTWICLLCRSFNCFSLIHCPPYTPCTNASTFAFVRFSGERSTRHVSTPRSAFQVPTSYSYTAVNGKMRGSFIAVSSLLLYFTTPNAEDESHTTPKEACNFWHWTHVSVTIGMIAG